ncbi:MAG: hypothetical protein DIZ80_08235, partial [endosymbiont of Galathealinum brachiosum]
MLPSSDGRYEDETERLRRFTTLAYEFVGKVPGLVDGMMAAGDQVMSRWLSNSDNDELALMLVERLAGDA